jgi:hypothetical protein
MQSPAKHAEAEAYFHKSLVSARNQHAKSFELRAVTSLAPPVAVSEQASGRLRPVGAGV